MTRADPGIKNSKLYWTTQETRLETKQEVELGHAHTIDLYVGRESRVLIAIEEHRTVRRRRSYITIETRESQGFRVNYFIVSVIGFISCPALPISLVAMGVRHPVYLCP